MINPLTRYMTQGGDIGKSMREKRQGFFIVNLFRDFLCENKDDVFQKKVWL